MNVAPCAYFRWSLVCLTLLSGLFGLTGCNSDPTPITSQTSKYEVADGEGTTTDSAADSTRAAVSPADRTPPPAGSDSSAQPTGARTASAVSSDIAADPAFAAQEPAPTKPSSSQPGEVTAAPTSDDPKELLAYMNELMTRQPRGTTRAEQLARHQETQQEIIKVANRILAAKNADEATILASSEGKFQAYSTLIQMGHPDAPTELQVFVGELVKSKNPQLVRLGRRIAFAQLMGKYDPSNDAATKKLVSEFHSLFDSEKKDNSLFMLGTDVARIFMQSGKNPEALDVMKTTHAAFLEQKDSPLAAQIRSLGEEIKFVELDINVRVREFVEEAPNSEQVLIKTLDKLFADKDAGPTTLQIVMQLLPLLESRSLDGAAHVYGQIEKVYANSTNPDIANLVKTTVESFSKRKGLIGKPFVVEGVNMDGSPFDWSKLKGKVVLVDFWATWCQPCLQEMPNIRQNYEQYREMGFEVVGVNIDEDPEAVMRFFSQQKLAWPTVRSADPNKTGFEHPLLVQSGAEGIPFLVLIGRDGNVVALNPRGEQLGKKLGEMFAANEEKPAEPAAKPQTKNKTSGLRPKATADVASSFVASDSPVFDSQPMASTATLGGVAQTNGQESSSVSCADEEKEPNPYLASPELDTKELVNFILEMQDKPRSIQQREGFAAAISDAADRILAKQASDKEQLIAIQAKFTALHQAAINGDEEADKQLAAFAEKLKNDPREPVLIEVRFVQAERKAKEILEAAPDKINTALDELQSYFQNAQLTDRHLRMASTIVEAINKVKEKDLREKRFKQFGDYFAKSENKVLARYGARLAEPAEPDVADWVGKPLELTGTTVLGTPFDWASYRNKIVIVDVWATWCGPCREQMPRLVALHEKLAAQGFDVVGVSVDKDSAALEEFLGKNEVPWTTLSGQEAFDFAKRLGIRGIPTMLLVDRDGKVLATAHSVDELAPQAEKLLEKPKAGS